LSKYVGTRVKTDCSESAGDSGNSSLRQCVVIGGSE